jgi:hypothetical protein
MSRSRNYVIAAVLAGLLSLANTIVALAVLPRVRTTSTTAVTSRRTPSSSSK